MTRNQKQHTSCRGGIKGMWPQQQQQQQQQQHTSCRADMKDLWLQNTDWAILRYLLWVASTAVMNSATWTSGETCWGGEGGGGGGGGEEEREEGGRGGQGGQGGEGGNESIAHHTELEYFHGNNFTFEENRLFNELSPVEVTDTEKDMGEGRREEKEGERERRNDAGTILYTYM